MADSSRHTMSYILESTYGETPATPALKDLRHTGTTLGLSKNSTLTEELREDRQIACFRHGARQVGGDVTAELWYSALDDMLEAGLCGTWAVDTPIAGTEQLKAGVVRRSFSILREFSDIASVDKPFLMTTGAEVNTWEMSVTADAIVTTSFGFIGQNQAVSATAPAGSTSVPAATGCPITSFSGSILEGGVAIADVTEATITLDNGIEPRFVVGSDMTIEPKIGRSNLTGSITAYFENSALLEKFIDETPSSLELNLVDEAGNAYRFLIPNIKYTGGQPDVSGDVSITLAMPFQAIYDVTEDSQITIERTDV